MRRYFLEPANKTLVPSCIFILVIRLYLSKQAHHFADDLVLYVSRPRKTVNDVF